MSLFERPHRSFSSYDVVMGLKPEALREVDDYDVWMDKVQAELVAVYGDEWAHLTSADIFYSTREAPSLFSSRISAETFQRLREYKTVLASLEKVTAQVEEQTKALQQAEAALTSAKEAGDSLRMPQRNVRTMKAKLTQLRHEEGELNYQRMCLSQQLCNVFKAVYVRVSLV